MNSIHLAKYFSCAGYGKTPQLFGLMIAAQRTQPANHWNGPARLAIVKRRSDFQRTDQDKSLKMGAQIMIKILLPGLMGLLSAVTALQADGNDAVRESGTNNTKFIEVLYELSLAPFSPDDPVKQPREIQGWLLESHDVSAPPIFHPATGEPRETAEFDDFLIGERFRILDLPNGKHPPSTREHRSFSSRNGKEPMAWNSISRPDNAPAPYKFWLPIQLWPEFVFEARLDGAGYLAWEHDGHSRTLKPKRRLSLAEEHTPVEKTQLLEAIRIRFGPESTRHEKWQQAWAEQTHTTVYTRVSVIFHGEVSIASRDLLHELKAAEHKAKFGPYEQALEHAAYVLWAVPDNRPALGLMANVSNWLEQGRTASSLAGTVSFPGTEMASDAAEGIFAILFPADRSRQDLVTSAPIRQGEFRIDVPSGDYKLMVAVPGFQPHQSTLTVKGEVRVEVDLRP